MKRPLRSRVWFYKPDFALDRRWVSAHAWKLWTTGGDEFNWHTIVVGFPWTGQIVFAHRACPRTGACAEELDDPDFQGIFGGDFDNEWPLDVYNFYHGEDRCCSGAYVCPLTRELRCAEKHWADPQCCRAQNCPGSLPPEID